jgi:hypothetical protein
MHLTPPQRPLLGGDLADSISLGDSLAAVRDVVRVREPAAQPLGRVDTAPERQYVEPPPPSAEAMAAADRVATGGAEGDACWRRMMMKEEDDLRKDQLVCDNIRLMKAFVESELNLSAPLPVVHYNVLPTAVNAGMIEVCHPQLEKNGSVACQFVVCLFNFYRNDRRPCLGSGQSGDAVRHR